MKSRNLMVALLLVCTSSVYAQDADMSLIPYREGDLWGYSAPDRRIVVKPQYNEAGFFYEGYAVVKKGSKYGYVNKDGKVVIPIKYYSAKPFRYGFYPSDAKVKEASVDKQSSGQLNSQKGVLFAGASLRSDGYEICIDTKGQVLRRCPAISDNAAPEINKPMTTTLVSTYSSIPKSDVFDRVVGDYKMPNNDDTYYIGMKNDKYGVFNNKMEVIVPFEYSSIKNVNINGSTYLVSEKNGMKGVLFGNGTSYMGVDNSNVLYVKAKNGKDYFIFSKAGKTGVKDEGYNDVIPADYSDILYDNEGGYVLVGNENMKGFYFLNGKKVEPKYSDVRLLKGGALLAVKTHSGKVGYIGSNGIEYFVE